MYKITDILLLGKPPAYVSSLFHRKNSKEEKIIYFCSATRLMADQI